MDFFVSAVEASRPAAVTTHAQLLTNSTSQCWITQPKHRAHTPMIVDLAELDPWRPGQVCHRSKIASLKQVSAARMQHRCDRHQTGLLHDEEQSYKITVLYSDCGAQSRLGQACVYAAGHSSAAAPGRAAATRVP